jgi:hypothetical protein
MNQQPIKKSLIPARQEHPISLTEVEFQEFSLIGNQIRYANNLEELNIIITKKHALFTLREKSVILSAIISGLKNMGIDMVSIAKFQSDSRLNNVPETSLASAHMGHSQVNSFEELVTNLLTEYNRPVGFHAGIPQEEAKIKLRREAIIRMAQLSKLDIDRTANMIQSQKEQRNNAEAEQRRQDEFTAMLMRK